MKLSAGEGAVANNTLGLRAIHDFPRFTDLFSWGKIFAIKRRKLSSSPNPLHKDRVEGEWGLEIRHGDFALERISYACSSSVSTIRRSVFLCLRSIDSAISFFPQCQPLNGLKRIFQPGWIDCHGVHGI